MIMRARFPHLTALHHTPSASLPTLREYFKSYYRGDSNITHSTIAQFLLHVDDNIQHHDRHYLIAAEHREEFTRIVKKIASALYSPYDQENSIYNEYEVDDVSIMIEGSTRPIRLRIRHPDLPNELTFKKTFYVKKNSAFNPRLICSFLYYIFSLYPFSLWVNDKLIMTSEAEGTVASRLPPGRLNELMQKPVFLHEAIRCNVSIQLMLVADLYPKNYIVCQVLNKALDATWKIIPIDFDHAFLPQNLDEPRLIATDPAKPLVPENNLMETAIHQCYSEQAIRVFKRQEEERLAGIYLDEYQRLNLLFDILRGKTYRRTTFKELNQEFVERYQFGVVSPFLGDLLKNSFDYLLHKLS